MFGFNYKSYNQDRIDAGFADGTNKITNTSNVPYVNPIYSNINSIGRAWIFEYTLAKAKEVLGYVRGKYSTVPIPGAEVTLNQQDLLSAATAEKEALLTQLREMLEASLPSKLIEEQAVKADKSTEILKKVPMFIYIG